MWLRAINIHNLSSVNRETVWHLQWVLIRRHIIVISAARAFVAASSELELLNKLDHAVSKIANAKSSLQIVVMLFWIF